VAWFPLGPQEVYRPVYAVSPRYVRNVNVTNVTNVTNITNVNGTNVRYVNQNVQGAATAMPQNAFATGRPVAQAALPVTPQQMANAEVSHTAMVAPQRESVLATARPGQRVAQPPAAMMSRQVVAKATPPPPPVSFQSQQAALAQNQGRPLAPGQVSQIRQQQPAVVNRPMVRQATAPPAAPTQPAGQLQQPAPRNRFESRPPAVAQPAQQQQPAARAPEFNRPAPAQQPAARPMPAPAARPEPARPEGARPAQQNRPPAQRREQKKEAEKKDDRR
jgi:hypothetical protein